MERYSNGPDCVKCKLGVISKKLTQKTEPTEGIPHMSGNGGLNSICSFTQSRQSTVLKSCNLVVPFFFFFWVRRKNGEMF